MLVLESSAMPDLTEPHEGAAGGAAGGAAEPSAAQLSAAESNRAVSQHVLGSVDPVTAGLLQSDCKGMRSHEIRQEVHLLRDLLRAEREKLKQNRCQGGN